MSGFVQFGEWDTYRFLYKLLPFVVEITARMEVFTTKIIYTTCHLLPSNLLEKKPLRNPNPKIFSSIEDTQKPAAPSRVLTPRG